MTNPTVNKESEELVEQIARIVDPHAWNLRDHADERSAEYSAMLWASLDVSVSKARRILTLTSVGGEGLRARVQSISPREVESETELAAAVEDLLSGYRTKYRNAFGRVRENAPLRVQFANLAETFAAWDRRALRQPSLTCSEDYVVVPRDPTEAMLNAGFIADRDAMAVGPTLGWDSSTLDGRYLERACWSAMIAAAPSPARARGAQKDE